MPATKLENRLIAITTQAIFEVQSQRRDRSAAGRYAKAVMTA
jgi:hypothetical protein